MSPEQFHFNIMNLTKLSLQNLLIKYHMEYIQEPDQKMKMKRLETYREASNNLFKIISALTVMEQHPVESVHVRTKEGTIYKCETINPEELQGNELADMLIEFSKGMK